MRNKSTPEKTPGAGNRPLAWLILLAGIPVFIALSLGWAELYFRVKSLVSSHLSGFMSDTLEGFIGDVGIPALATALVLYFGAGFFAERAEYQCRTRRGWRYLGLTVLGFVLAFLALVGQLPLPYKPEPSVVYNVCLGLGIYGLCMGKTFWKIRVNRKAPAEAKSICVFCYLKEEAGGKTKLEPFATVTGVPRLMRDDGSVEVPECPSKKLDAELFNRVCHHVAREERVMEQTDWNAIWLFDSFFSGYKVVGEYLMVLNRGEEGWRIGSALRISPDHKSYPAFTVGPNPYALGGQLKGSRNYHFFNAIGWEKSPRNCPRAVWERAEKKAGRPPIASETTIPLLLPAVDMEKPTQTLTPKPVSAAKPTASGVKTVPTSAPTQASTTKSADQSAAVPKRARQALTEQERKALVRSIYRRGHREIWAAIDQLKLPIQNICDIEDGKLSDEALQALEDALRQTPKQETKKTSTQTTKQTPTPAPKQTPKQTSTPNKILANEEKRIYIVLDSSLTEAERNAVARAVEDTRQVFPSCTLELTGQGKSAAAEGIRKNMDTYLEGTRQENGRYDASQILRRLESLAQYKKEAAAILLLTGQDLCLNSQGASWCFGAGNGARHTAVCSLYRYQELTAPERLRCVRRTLRHEIGHALGLAMDPKRTNTEKHFGVHCTAPGCSMRQTENLLKLLRFSREEEQQGWWFCPDCLADLEKALSKAGKQE